MLRFEEFSALRRRQSPVDGSKAQSAEPALVSAASQVDKAGFYLEALEVQIITIGLIAADIIGSVVTIMFTCGGDSQSALERAVLNLVESLMGFTLVYFIMELGALVFAFKLSFFAHLGNLLDTAVIAVCLVYEIQGKSRGIRLVGLLRSWRFLRLVSTLMARKDKDMESAIEGWQHDQELLEKSRVEIARLEDALRRESDSKKRVEKMLKGYKDEVETLNEALKIAALDIANAGGDQLLLDEEYSDENSDLSSTRDGPLKTDTRPEKPSGGGTKTFFVKNDGTYELREI